MYYIPVYYTINGKELDIFLCILCVSLNQSANKFASLCLITTAGRQRAVLRTWGTNHVIPCVSRCQSAIADTTARRSVAYLSAPTLKLVSGLASARRRTRRSECRCRWYKLKKKIKMNVLQQNRNRQIAMLAAAPVRRKEIQRLSMENPVEIP